MNGDTPQNSAATPGDDQELGEPIGALRDLEQDTSVSFLSGIRKKLHRRTTASQLVSFAWRVPRVVAVELANMSIQILNALSIRKGE